MRKRTHKSKYSGPRHPRLVSRGDGFTVLYKGRKNLYFGDLYVDLLGASWKTTILFMVGLYLFINILFALAYLALGNGIQNAHPGSFTDAFFFSVQTLATIGYGTMFPHGFAANVLMTVESMFGFAFYGVVTGLVFSKFSRPTSRIIFSDKAIVTQHDGKRHFMLRLANERNNRIVDASVKLTFMRDRTTAEGVLMRTFYDLQPARKDIPILRLTWTIMHEINEDSPLFGMTREAFTEAEGEIIVSVKGMDETLSQTIHARHSYIADEIVHDKRFEDVLIRRDDYVLEVHIDKFHQLIDKEPVNN